MLKYYLLLCLIIIDSLSITIILDPAGDAHHTGRIIGESFERGITAQFAKELKKELDLLHIKTIMTRYPGEALEPLQGAYLANKLNADLYINISFYPEVSKNKNLNTFVYYSLYDSTDSWSVESSTLSFLPYNKAYKKSFNKSKLLAETFFNNLTILKASHIIGFPFRPLVGIMVPAFGIEIGLYNSEDWKQCISPVINSLKSCIKEIEGE